MRPRRLLPTILLAFLAASAAAADGLTLALNGPAAPDAPPRAEPVLVASQTWGSVNPSSLILRRTVPLVSDADHVADVLFDNHLTTGNVDVKAATLLVDGLVVHVTVIHGAERVPDLLRVEPPVGYVARPASATVEDGTVGLIEIHRVPLG